MTSPAPRPSVRWADLALVGAGLLVLLSLSALTALGHPARWKSPVSLGIAAAKTALIGWFFMQLRTRRSLIWLAVGAGLAWLTIAAVLIGSDYLTR